MVVVGMNLMPLKVIGRNKSLVYGLKVLLGYQRILDLRGALIFEE
jgi:hypothetical protein